MVKPQVTTKMDQSRVRNSPQGGLATANLANLRQPQVDALSPPELDSPLRTWLWKVRSRGYRITVNDGVPTVSARPPMRGCKVTDVDRSNLARYHHALLLAAAGSHPTWWSWVTGNNRQRPTIHQIPTVTDPTTEDGLAFACTTCGAPTSHIDDQALAWCPEHRRAA